MVIMLIAHFPKPLVLQYSSLASGCYFPSSPCQNSNDKIAEVQKLLLHNHFEALVPPVDELVVKGCHLQIPPTTDILFHLGELKGTLPKPAEL